MDFFDCSSGELAKVFAKDEKLYGDFYFSLFRLKEKINPKINLEKALEKIDEAKKICSEGRHFLFSVSDDYSSRGIGYGEGFELYKLVIGEMIPIFQTDQSVPQLKGIIKYLKKNNLKEIYNPTFKLAGDYSGAEGCYPDQGGDYYRIEELSESDDLSEFLKEGIEIIGIDFNEED